MVTFFNLMALIFWGLGLVLVVLTTSSVNQIGGMVMILTGMVAAVGAALLDQLQRIAKRDAPGKAD